MNIEAIVEYFRKFATIRENAMISDIVDYITNLEEEKEALKERCDYLQRICDRKEEEKKIPEKLSTWFSVETKQSKELNIEYANTNFENMYEKINEIIDCLDYLNSKGDE